MINGVDQRALFDNDILAALPVEEYQRLRPRMRLVQLSDKQTIYRVGEPIRMVYFPSTAVLSLMQTFKNGSIMELGMVGYKGVSGLSALLGSDVARFEMLVRVPGLAYQLPAADIANELRGSGLMGEMLRRYIITFLSHIAHRIACVRHHTVEQRMASHLLMLRDLVGPRALRLTHEVLAQILGVNRPTVTLNIDAMQQTGVVVLGRGIITVLDWHAIEMMACECYEYVHDEYVRLFGSRASNDRWLTAG